MIVFNNVKISQDDKYITIDDKQVKSNASLSLDPQRAKTLGEVLKSIL